MIARVVGVSFSNDEYGINRQDVIKELSGNEKVFLKREPNNRFDKNAVAVMAFRGEKHYKIGFLRAELAGLVSELWKEYKFFAKIVEIRPGSDTVPWGLSIEISKTKRVNVKKNLAKKNEEVA